MHRLKRLFNKINENPPSNPLKKIGILSAIIFGILKVWPEKKSLVEQNSLKASLRIIPSSLILSKDSIKIKTTVYNAGTRPAENIQLFLYLLTDSSLYIDDGSRILQLYRGQSATWPKAMLRNYCYWGAKYYLTDNEINKMYLGFKATFKDPITNEMDSSVQISKVYERHDTVATLGLVTDPEYKAFQAKDWHF
jgi:hypothetical protein